mgnify:FL=1
MKNILAVIGGGRPKGNTEQLVDAFAQGAETAGNQVEKILLRKTEVKGCTGCNACHHTGFCVQKDDFNSLIPKIRKANLIVFASPLYYWTISSQLKAFIDRFYSIEEKELPLHSHEKYAQKDSVLLMTAADHSSRTFEQAVSYYQFALVNYIGFRDKGMLLAGGCGSAYGKSQIEGTDHLQKAYEFGKTLYQNKEEQE